MIDRPLLSLHLTYSYPSRRCQCPILYDWSTLSIAVSTHVELMARPRAFLAEIGRLRTQFEFAHLYTALQSVLPGVQ